MELGRPRPQVRHRVSVIYLNALELTVSKAEIEYDVPVVADASEVDSITPATAVHHNVGGSDVLAIAFGAPLPTGEATLRLAFQGTLNDHLAGFYRSKYVVDGQVRYLATTQFEATDARRAFPCWDEPALKATFDISLTVPSHLVAVSNMPVVQSTLHPSTGLRDVVFGRTPVMSTYLVAFVVGEFDNVAALTEEGVEVRVYTPVGKVALGQFALRVATRALSFYTKLFGIPYPLPKMDLLAIPDFAAGAMENWGCITYREFALLIDEQQSSQERRQRVARTVCHEIAHQWYGGERAAPNAAAVLCSPMRRLSARRHPLSDRWRWRTGSATSSRWSGGPTCGSTRALRGSSNSLP